MLIRSKTKRCWSAIFLVSAIGLVLSGGCGKRVVDPIVEARSQFAQALRESGLVTDAALLRAIEAVPFHELTEPPTGPEAYGEVPVITSPEGISESALVDAVMVAAAEVKRGNKVLDLAPGLGYRAALCTKMGAQVCCVAGAPQEVQILKSALARIGCGSVIVHLGRKAGGCPQYGPFNVLFADWDVSNIPEAIMDQIRNQGRVVLWPRMASDRILVFKCQKTTLSPMQTISLTDVFQRYRTARISISNRARQ